MGWATQHIANLKAGQTVKFRPHGNSMTGIINNGDLVTVEPLKDTVLVEGDAVLCRVNGSQYVHLITAIGSDGRYQISNNHGHVNGWTKAVYGKVISVEP